MRTIGLLGGMSWQSTVPYYQTINRVVGERLGGLHSARIVLYSVDFHDIEQRQHSGRWSEAADILVAAARALERAEAAFLVLCTNTMHKVAPQIEAAVPLPLLHIADPTAERITAAGARRVGLLATRFTMEDDFYRGRLQGRHGLDVLVPSADDRAVVHRVIYEELCRGRIREESRAEYRRIMRSLVEKGAEAVILGCTEIGLLVGPGDASVPLFDTTQIHAEARRLFLALILTQIAHSAEEYWFALYEVLLPARIVSGYISSNLAVGFAIANAALIAFAFWCYLARVRTGHPSGRMWAWFWTALEAANGTAHLFYAAARGAYFPGAATAPVLLALAIALAVRLRTERPA
jgi:aspartate racemase